MKSPPWLNTAIASSAHAVGEVLNRLFATPSDAQASAWTEQFSAASHDQPDARCRVHALYRAATVRL